MTDLAVSESNPLLLPALQGEVNNTDIVFETISRGNRSIPQIDTIITYGDTSAWGFIETTPLSSRKLLIQIDTVEKIFIPEERVFDIIKIYASDINNNINNKDTVKHGTIELELLSFKEKRNPLMMFFSVWTLCVPSLVGVPITSIRTNLEIQVSIRDNQGKSIKRYIASGDGRTFIAPYWGYGGDAWRKSNILAFKEAMTSIKSQMKADSIFLKDKLNDN